MDRAERLLNLVTLFLNAKKPVPFEHIRNAFPDAYEGSTEAANRKFERDKADLLEAGIPVQYKGSVDEDVPGGYAIDQNDYYLPNVDLAPAELAMLFSAGSAALESGAFPGKRDLEHALRKIGYASDDIAQPRSVRFDLDVGPSSDPNLPAHLDALWRAVSDRKWVDLEYFSPAKNEHTTRRVDPYALSLRRGVWQLVGYCHLRTAVRTFMVHRISDVRLNTAKPRAADYEIPSTFRLEDHVATRPWEHRFHAPVEVLLELSGPLERQAGTLFDAAPRPEGGSSTIQLSVTNLDGLARYVLSLGDGIRVRSPQSAAQRVVELALNIERAHAGATS